MLKIFLYIIVLIFAIQMYSLINMASQASSNLGEASSYFPVNDTLGHINLHQYRNDSDVCFISKAMQRTEMRVYSYYPMHPFVLSKKSTPHAASILCNMEKNQISSISEKKIIPKSGFVFKTARSGSTFLEEVLRNTFKNATMVWEPFASIQCSLKSMKAEFQEKSLNKFLTHTCSMQQEVVTKLRGDERRNVICNANYNCSNVKPSLALVLANARFFNADIRWDRIFQNAISPSVILLRRTNLVLMGYSKFHHGGCVFRSSTKSRKMKYYIHNRIFTLDILLRCVMHYALGDQEIVTSRALQAAQKISEVPYLILYEDIMSTKSIVQNGLVKHLGNNIRHFHDKSIFQEDIEIKKEHTNEFCSYDDISCESLKKGLKKGYPCLLKQLQRASKGLAWSVPMLQNGEISIHGNCYPIPTLNERRNKRHIDDLYQLRPFK